MTQRRGVLIVAATTGYQTRSFGEVAGKLGVPLVFATDRCDQLEDPWWDQAIPIRFHDEEASVQAIVDAVNGAPPRGVLAVGDRPTVIAARAARAFDLPGNPPEAARASCNKLAFRRALRRAGLPVPWFEPIALAADPHRLAARVPYPCVIKPIALSGSRGVIRADGPNELVRAFERIRALMAAPDIRVERDPAHDVLMIEAFIPGREHAVEGLLTRGAFQTLAIFDKPDPLDGPFFEETIYITPSALPRELRDQVTGAVRAAAHALGLRHGPVHAEVRVNEDGVHVLEVAARPIGGLCSRAVRFAEGAGEVALEELLLRHALGQDVSAVAPAAHGSGVMMMPIPRAGILKSVDGIDDARAVDGIEDVIVTAKPDQKLVPLPEGRSYLGFIFARGDAAEDAEAALRQAHARLRIRIDRALL